MKLVTGLVTRQNQVLVVDSVVGSYHVEIMFAKELVIKLKTHRTKLIADLIAENVKRVVFVAVQMAAFILALDLATQIHVIHVCSLYAFVAIVGWLNYMSNVRNG